MSLLLLLALTIGVANAGKLFVEVEQEPTDRILCPDGLSSCSASGSCCQMGNGKWGCCPFTGASCCEDKVHCCPRGYSCNAANGQCTKAVSNETMPWVKKELAPVAMNNDLGAAPNIVCPDRGTCPPLSACCRTHYGTYGCCTYPHNVCCSDGKHCCLRGYVCDLVSFVCRPGFLTEDWTPLALAKSTPAEKGLEWMLVKEDE